MIHRHPLPIALLPPTLCATWLTVTSALPKVLPLDESREVFALPWMSAAHTRWIDCTNSFSVQNYGNLRLCVLVHDKPRQSVKHRCVPQYKLRPRDAPGEMVNENSPKTTPGVKRSRNGGFNNWEGERATWALVGRGSWVARGLLALHLAEARLRGRLLPSRSLPPACPLRGRATHLGGSRTQTDQQGLLAAGRGLALRQTAALLRARAPCAPVAAASALQTGFGEGVGEREMDGGGIGREIEKEMEGARAVSLSGRGHGELSPPSAA